MPTTTEIEIDRERSELIGGEWIEKPMGNEDHSDIEFRLVALLRERYAHVGRATLELTIRFEPDILIPDVCMRSPGNEIPFLCVEVRSPGQPLSSLISKCERYASYGVRYCWIIDPIEARAYVYDGSNRGEPSSNSITRVDILYAGDQIELKLAEILRD